MATIIGGLGTCHAISIGVAFDRGLRESLDWRPFFNGYEQGKSLGTRGETGHRGRHLQRPRNAFFLDRVPTFAVGVADRYHPAVEGWGPRATHPFADAPDFSWHLVDKPVERHFDPLGCRHIDVDHGLQVPMELIFGRSRRRPVKVVPVWVNTIQYLVPTPQRC